MVAGAIAVATAGGRGDGPDEARGQVLGTVVERTEAAEGVRPGPPATSSAPRTRFGASTTITTPQPNVLHVEMVGDSLLASAIENVVAALGDAVVSIDAEPGRTIGQGRLPIATAVAANPDAVVIALGTNDWASPPEQVVAHLAEIERLLEGASCVIWIDAQEFRPGLAEVNAQVRRLAEKHVDVHVARWSILAGSPEFHLADGYHLSGEGREMYAGLIDTAVDLHCA